MPTPYRPATLALTLLAMAGCGATSSTSGPAAPSTQASSRADPTDSLTPVALPDEALSPQLPHGHPTLVREPGGGFPAGSPVERAAVAGGLTLAYERFSALANVAAAIADGDVSLYRFPSDQAASPFLAALNVSYVARATHTGAASAVPGGTEYEIAGTGPGHSLSVIGLRHGVVFLVALGGTAVTSPMIEKAAKQQYDRL